MKHLLLISLFVTAQISHSVAQEFTFPPQKLREDLLILHQTLKQFHPGYDRHVSAASLDSMFNQLRRRIEKPMNSWEFYRLAAEGVASLKCGHTRLPLTGAMQAQFEKECKFFPLAAMVANKKLIVRLPDKSLREVVSVNKISVDKILEVIFSRFPVDGYAVLAKYDYVQDFWLYYSKYYDHNTGLFEIVVNGGEGHPDETIALPAINFAQASALVFSKKEMPAPITFKMIKGTAYLDINTFSSFAYTAQGVSYTKFLDKTFTALGTNDVNDLIIDIRGNGGGDDLYGAILMGYVARKPFPYFRRVVTKENGSFVPVDHPCLAMQPRFPLAFNGHVFLLIDGKTFSTAADVASVFTSSSRGLVVGRETGGGYEGNTSGASKRVGLPNTGLTIVIPLWYYENAVKPPIRSHRGVIPDVTIERTLKSLIQNIDPELEYVFGKM